VLRIVGSLFNDCNIPDKIKFIKVLQPHYPYSQLTKLGWSISRTVRKKSKMDYDENSERAPSKWDERKAKIMGIFNEFMGEHAQISSKTGSRSFFYFILNYHGIFFFFF
jgi:hypothetical protein